jgi:transcriptional regulator with XRE-family HTH domain
MPQLNRIKEVLKEKGIKINWVAEQINKSYPTMIAYTSNTRQPNLEDLYKIAEALGVSPKSLLVEENDKEEN